MHFTYGFLFLLQILLDLENSGLSNIVVFVKGVERSSFSGDRVIKRPVVVRTII